MGKKRTEFDIAVFGGGGYDEVAAEIGISRAALYLWRKHGIPGSRLEAFVEATGHEREKLEPYVRETTKEKLERLERIDRERAERAERRREARENASATA